MAKNSRRDLERAILDEARGVLLSRGYAALSMRRIASEVGCTATSIYLYFENKDALVHALIDEGFERLYGELGVAVAGFSDPGERVARLSRRYIEFGLENPAYYEVMFMLRPNEMERYPVDKYRRARRNIELLAGILGEPHAPAPAVAAIDFHLLLTLLWAGLHGTVALLLARRVDASVDKGALIDAAVANTMTILADWTALEKNSL